MTCNAASRDFCIKHGYSGVSENPDGMVFRFKNANETAYDFAGSEVVFFARYGGLVLRKTSADNGVLVDLTESLVTVPISVEESRIFRALSFVPYELERRIGMSQELLVQGTITIKAGINDD